MPLFGPTMPTPLDDDDTREFWDACREHRLVVQRCRECAHFRFAPAPVCFNCRSFDYEWVESEGLGEVYSWTVTYRAVHPATVDAVPYNTVVVRLLDCGGAMITSNLLDVDNDAIEAGMRVQVQWDDISPDLSLPRFRPVPEETTSA